MNIENIYKQKLEQLANLFNLTIEEAEKFYLAGIRELMNNGLR